MNLGEFRELTSDLPDDWPVIHVHDWGDGFTFSPADASVSMTERRVEVVSEGWTAGSAPVMDLTKRDTE